MDDEDAVLIAAHFAESEGVQFQPWFNRIGEKVEFAKQMIEEHEGLDAVLPWACGEQIILR